MVCFLRQEKGLWSDTKLQYNLLDLPNCPSNSQAIGTLERFSNERRKTKTKGNVIERMISKPTFAELDSLDDKTEK